MSKWLPHSSGAGPGGSRLGPVWGRDGRWGPGSRKERDISPTSALSPETPPLISTTFGKTRSKNDTHKPGTHAPTSRLGRHGPQARPDPKLRVAPGLRRGPRPPSCPPVPRLTYRWAHWDHNPVPLPSHLTGRSACTFHSIGGSVVHQNRALLPNDLNWLQATPLSSPQLHSHTLYLHGLWACTRILSPLISRPAASGS